MGSNTNSAVCKLCRREGAKLFLKGERCFTDKCSFERRPYPPGQFGAGRVRLSEYGTQLREKQKTKRIYMLQEKQFRSLYDAAIRKRGVKGLNLLRLLELRLDSVCLRLGFADTMNQARQLVTHGHFLVNGKKLTFPSYTCRIGDEISIRGDSDKISVIQAAIENAKRKTRPDWMEFDEKAFKGRLVRLPEREDITQPITERYIVELYSK